jgi:Carboxypeptidase regulatory-like domain
MKRILAYSSLGAITLAVILFVVFHNPDAATDPAPNLSAIAATPEVNPDVAAANEAANTEDANDAELEIADSNTGRTELAAADVPAMATEAAHGSLAFRLVDSEKNPVVGATAQLIYSKNRGFSSRLMMINLGRNEVFKETNFEAQSNQDGKVLLNDVKPGASIVLEILGAHWSQRTVSIAALDPGEARELGDLPMSPGVLLTGLVKGPKGKAVKGAKVRILEEDASGMGFRFASMGADADREGETDEEGRFRFEGMAMGAYSLELTAPGFVKSITSLEIEAARPDHAVELQMVSGASVFGVVRDEEGTPLPDAFVALISSRGFAMAQWDHDRVMKDGMQVQEDGSFALAGLPEKGGYRVVAAAPGFARGRSEKVMAGDKLDIQLGARMSVHGTLQDALGEAVAEGEITLRNQEEGKNGGLRSNRATTDADGNFDFDDLSEGTYKVEVSAAAGTLVQENLAIGAVNPDLNLTLPAGEALLVKVMNEEGESLELARVRVAPKAVDNADLEVSGRRIRISSGGSFSTSSAVKSSRSGRTDEGGMVRFVGLAAAQWTIKVKKEGYADMVVDFVRQDGDDQLEIVVMPKASSLRLLAIDANRDPVANARVKLARVDDENFEALSASTDPWGLAVWSNLAPGVYVVSEDSDAGSSSVMFQFDNLDGDNEAEAEPANKIEFEIKADEISEQEIILAAKAVTTVLVTRMGLPVANASVKLVNQGAFDFGWGFGDDGDKAITDASGLAILPPADAGSYVLEGRASSSNPPTKLTVNLIAGAQQVNLELASGVISGTVMGLSGSLSGAKVRLESVQVEGEDETTHTTGFVSMSFNLTGDEDDNEMETFEFTPGQATSTSGRDGQFRFQDVPAGTYRLNITAKGYTKFASESFEHDGAGQLERGVLQMEVGASLKGKILGLSNSLDGGMISTRIVRLIDEDDNTKHISMIRKDGRYEFKDLTPGNYRLSVEIDDQEIESELISVRTGNPTEFNFSL